jgi:Zn-dependent metalloprotease
VTAAPPPAWAGSDGRRLVYDASGGGQLPGTLVREEGDPPDALAAVNEAYDGLGATRDFFLQLFQRDSVDDRGAPLVASVQVTQDGELMGNAFWNGDQMAFGDGDGVVFDRFTRSLDVIGHELTHAVVQHSSRLQYFGQSGALNEHFADVFGVLLRHRQLGQDARTGDWRVGADVVLPTKKTRWALRDMANPGTAFIGDPYMGTDPQPGHMNDLHTGPEDNQGVHINSGIPNRAFVEFARAVGGFAFDVPGQIWYEVMLGLVFNSDFQDCAALSVQVASSHEAAVPGVTQLLRAAWQTVGITVP